jgi:hypothetical protein
MKKLDAITLDFARQVIEEETGTPLDIQAPSADEVRARAAAAGGGGAAAAAAAGAVNGAGEGAGGGNGNGHAPVSAANGGEARLIARDDKKNPLISTFDWTGDALQRVFRVPAGFMRNKTQERIEELARERAVTAIDLALVEDGIEIGKRMMAEMIATYTPPGAPAAAPAANGSAPANGNEASNGSGYLNEVNSRTPTRP